MPFPHYARPSPLARMRSTRSTPPQIRPKPSAIGSDDSALATSDILVNVPMLSRFDLEMSFPAILAPFSFLHKVPESQDVDALRALAPVFAHCIDEILHFMHHLPKHIPTSPKYHLALSGVNFAKDRFLGHVNSIPRYDRSPSRREAINAAMHFLDVTMSSLKDFLNIATFEVAQLKPLPRIPAPGELARVAHECDAPETHQFGRNEYPHGSQSTDTLAGSQESKDSALLKPPVPRYRVRKRPSRTESAGLDSAVSGTLVNSELDDLGCRYVHVSVNTRNSLAHFPISIDAIPGTAPHPEDAAELWKDRKGLAQLASLKALVRYITSPDGDSDTEIVDVFFLCFRFFSSPKEVFQTLVARYNENLTGRSASSTRSHSTQVQIRIARLLYLWVDLHWQAKDVGVLPSLTQFVFSRLVHDIPQEASLSLLSSLHQRTRAGENSRGLRKERTIARAEEKYRRDFLCSTWEPKEKKSMMKRDFSKVKPEHFHSAGGHAMLALQITLLLWEKYCSFEPEDAVRYLMTRNGDDGSPMTDVARKVEIFMAYEKAVHRFVMHSIGSARSTQKRTELTEFFLELATKCHELRNYSASCLIALACDRPTVLPFITKLKLSPAHERLKTTLMDFYTGENHHMTGYKQALQSCCCPALPGMMLFIREVARGCGSGPYEQHPIFPGPRLINLKRYRPITWAVRAMEKCHAPFRIQRNDYICDWLEHVLSQYVVGTELEWENRIYENCRRR